MYIEQGKSRGETKLRLSIPSLYDYRRERIADGWLACRTYRIPETVKGEASSTTCWYCFGVDLLAMGYGASNRLILILCLDVAYRIVKGVLVARGTTASGVWSFDRRRGTVWEVFEVLYSGEQGASIFPISSTTSDAASQQKRGRVAGPTV